MRQRGLVSRFVLASVLLFGLASAGMACAAPLVGAVGTETVCGAGGQVAIADLREGRVAEGGDVILEGVVSGIFAGEQELGGFFLQQGELTPQGIFVYGPAFARSEIAIGQHLRLRGRFARFHGRPQVVQPVLLNVCAEWRALEPVALRLPAQEAQLEALLDVKVRFSDALVVTGNYELGRYGSLVLAPQERFFGTTSNDMQRPAGQEWRIHLDDGSYRRDPEPIPYLNPEGTRRAGDAVTELTGILTHAFSAYRVHPTMPPEFRADNPRPASPPPAEAGSFRVATLNLENYFLTLRQRGAANREAQRRQRDKLRSVVHAINADVLSLIEVENRPEAVQSLLDVLNDGLPPARRYRMLRHAAAGDDVIRQAIFYRPSRLVAAGEAADSESVHDRSPLLGWWTTVDGSGRFGVVSVHLKSKVGCPQAGDVDRGQGCWNERRTAQVLRLLEWLNEERRDAAPVIIAGDLNAYVGEDPIRTLLAAGKRDLVAEVNPQARLYTYVFRGVAGQLDYLLGSPTMNFRITGAGIWHINADEPPFLAYDGRRPAPGPWRSSDHDPVWVDMRFLDGHR
jgi:predicted extracellular nuclease